MATLQTDTQTLRHGTMSRFGEGTAVCETAFFLMLFFVAQIFLPEIVKKKSAHTSCAPQTQTKPLPPGYDVIREEKSPRKRLLPRQRQVGDIFRCGGEVDGGL